MKQVINMLDQLLEKKKEGTSPAVQQLRLCLPIQGVQVPSLVRELRSHIPHSKKEKKKKRERTQIRNEREEITTITTPTKP